ncbi:MAG TPA: FAD-dependent monooxygenase, partial [Gammaproteobacteria bacterium]
ALAPTRFRIVLMESASANARRDDRGLALSPATVRVFSALGLWDRLRDSATPIRRIHVSESGAFGAVRLDAAELGLEWLGQVVPSDDLGRLLVEEVSGRENIEFLRPARAGRAVQDHRGVALDVESGAESLQVQCRLLIAADGARSALRQALGVAATTHDYGQTAIVASVRPARAHGGAAFERFSPTGPTALLPRADGWCTAVLCVPRDGADAVLNMSDRDFLLLLEERSGRRLGGFLETGPRGAWPLVRVVAEAQMHGRTLFMGNAAHTVHPNAAQGFNLAVRDIAALAELLSDVPDPGSSTLLADYVAVRETDHESVVGFTHGLAELFYNDHCGRKLVRRTGMLLAERLPAVKRALVRRAAGLYGRQPACVRGVAP